MTIGKQTSYWSKTGFFLSLSVKKENDRFSSHNLYRNIVLKTKLSQNIIPDNMKKTLEVLAAIFVIENSLFCGSLKF